MFSSRLQFQRSVRERLDWDEARLSFLYIIIYRWCKNLHIDDVVEEAVVVAGSDYETLLEQIRPMCELTTLDKKATIGVDFCLQ